MSSHLNLTTAAPTVYSLAYDLRNAILAHQHEGAGALTFLLTAHAAWATRRERIARDEAERRAASVLRAMGRAA